jgi:hypothetical protein
VEDSDVVRVLAVEEVDVRPGAEGVTPEETVAEQGQEPDARPVEAAR